MGLLPLAPEASASTSSATRPRPALNLKAKAVIVQPIKTRILRPPRDNLLGVIKKSVQKIPERSILVISSKVVSIWQGRCLAKNQVADKKRLILAEADKYLFWKYPLKRQAIITVKNNILIRSAGVDESNAGGFLVLWPKQPNETAKKLQVWLKQSYRLKQIGVIIVDSHSIPLRRGTFGIALGYFGIQPIKDYREKKDLFGRSFRFTQMNIVDALATAGLLAMGEGAENTPMALISDVDFVKFQNTLYKPTKRFSSLEVPAKEDVFFSLLTKLPWKRGGI